uniref:DDB1 and CUL4 associated factor 11 n=1 Tax=Naja naja TaxID=35670 RepID=A0A8C6X833_NAJNA
MGSRSSSNTGLGGRENQGSWSRRDSGILRSEDEDENVDLAQVLAYLLRRGQFHLMQGGMFQTAILADTDSVWEGYLRDQYKPSVDLAPDTRDLEHSEIKTRIQLATGRLRPWRPDRSIPKLLGQRERGLCHNSNFSAGECSQIVSHFLPNHLTVKDTYSQKAFCGIYSHDGQIFMSACQDQRIRLYDCTYGAFRNFRSIRARDIGWSVLDIAFTPDRAHFLYSSWSDYIHMCSIYGESDTQTALDMRANYGFVYVFDMEQNKRTLKIDAHEDDVNAITFADNSSHIVFSGGDDALCKVWDRRTMREDDPQPVGILAGHQDGITFIDSKGDARYFISNSKDQTIKLWDIRKFSGQEGLEASHNAVTQQIWDYRWQQVPKKARHKTKLAGDTSLMTYRGHGVLHTLIRCRFSPPHSTGQQYIYSGCSTGRVVVYDLLSGLIVKKLVNHQACVRDVSWHPYEEKIVSSSVSSGNRCPRQSLPQTPGLAQVPPQSPHCLTLLPALLVGHNK